MKKIQVRLLWVYAVLLAIAVSCVRHEPGTNELIALMKEFPEMETMLVESILLAKETNPDPESNPAQTLEEYYDFIDWSSKAMPWNINPKLNYPKLYENIDQSLGYFYFVMDQPLEELDGKGYYHNSLQYYEPFSLWLVKFTKQWGAYLSTPGSWNESYYQMAYDDERFGLQNDWYEDSSNWHSFNDFFARYLASPDTRPIAGPADNAVVVAPADSKPQGVWSVDANSNIVEGEGVRVKTHLFKSVADIIGNDAVYKDSFANGTLTHTFLDIHDYHRYHFPMGGTVKAVRIVPAADAAGGVIVWNGELKKYELLSTIPGWQAIETRGYVILETKEYGLVALIPVGMSQISSVNFEDNVKIGAAFNKGDPLGYFLFGGSDFVIIFQAGTEFIIDAPSDNDGYSHILMGQRYGHLRPRRN